MNPMMQQQGAPQKQYAPQPGQEDPAQQMEQGGEDEAENEAPEVDQEEMIKLLFSRLDELSAQEAQGLARIITPETYPIFMKLLPEMEPLYITILEQQGGAPQQGQQPMPQPGQQPPPEENPLVNDEGLSRGLMG